MSELAFQKAVYTWRIEQIRFFCPDKTSRRLCSPKFIWKIDERRQVIWILNIILPPITDSNADYWNSDCIEYYLEMVKSDVKKLLVMYTLKVTDFYGDDLKVSQAIRQFSPSHANGFSEFLDKSKLDWPTKNGAITLRCEIERTLEAFEENSPRNILALTKIGVVALRNTYIGQINENHFVSFVVCSHKCALLCIKIKLIAEEKIVSIKITKIDDLKLAICDLILLIENPSNDPLYYGKYEHLFSNSEDDTWNITFRPYNYQSLLHNTIVIKTKINISNNTEHSQIADAPLNQNVFQDQNYPTASYPNSYLSMYINKKACDFTLVSADGIEFKANKCVLQDRSRYFDKMLTHDTIESQKRRVEFGNIDSEALDLILKYIYHPHPEDYKPNVARNLYAAAQMLELLDLKKHCSALMVAKLEVSNVFDVLEIAELHDDLTLKTFVEKFLIENADAVSVQMSSQEKSQNSSDGFVVDSR